MLWSSFNDPTRSFLVLVHFRIHYRSNDWLFPHCFDSIWYFCKVSIFWEFLVKCSIWHCQIEMYVTQIETQIERYWNKTYCAFFEELLMLFYIYVLIFYLLKRLERSWELVRSLRTTAVTCSNASFSTPLRFHPREKWNGQHGDHWTGQFLAAAVLSVSLKEQLARTNTRPNKT